MWSRPPRKLSLNEGDLHVWRMSLVPIPDLARLAGEVLSEKEKERCARFVRDEDRARCAAARAALRVVLSGYVSQPPGSLPIVVGKFGKPYLGALVTSSAAGVHDIQFNLAHAGDFLLIAVSRGARVGIDIERIRNVRGMESIVEDFFDEQERASVRSCKGRARSRMFFRLWTRRESAAKAMGLDLVDAFARCDLPAFDENRSGFRLVLPQIGSATGAGAGAPAGVPAGHSTTWWIRDFTPAPGYAGALCVEQANAEPSFFDLRFT